MLNETAFEPPSLLRNPHVQSILASSGLRATKARQRFPGMLQNVEHRIVDAGDGVRLSGLLSRQTGASRGLAVLIHGWEGSANSSYLLSTGGRLYADGFDVFRINLRDHGDSHGLNPELFHSCRLDEVRSAILRVRAEFADRRALIGGFSLGGNFALRVARATDAAFAFAFAVCPPLVPAASLAAIETAPWFYRSYFMQKWRQSLKRKQALFPERYDFREWLKLPMRELTRVLVAAQTDFASLEAYLDGYGIGADRLLSLRCPSLVIAAADDPVIPVADFYALQRPQGMQLEVLNKGGHCGFLANWRMESWFEARIHAQLQALGWLDHKA
jgi:uncharacterized protein